LRRLIGLDLYALYSALHAAYEGHAHEADAIPTGRRVGVAFRSRVKPKEGAAPSAVHEMAGTK
jgi:hypothetical protein